jgi:hypothetical protein
MTLHWIGLAGQDSHAVQLSKRVHSACGPLICIIFNNISGQSMSLRRFRQPFPLKDFTARIGLVGRGTPAFLKETDGFSWFSLCLNLGHIAHFRYGSPGSTFCRDTDAAILRDASGPNRG